MRHPGLLFMLFSLGIAFPLTNAAALPAVGGAAFANTIYVAYPHFGRAFYDRGNPRPPQSVLPEPYWPDTYHYRFQQPQPLHQRYFSLHGHRSPVWRAPGTLRFHHRLR